MVPELYEAWHAGKSNWKKDKSLNKKSIGIEISNNGHNFGYQYFSNKQINSLIKLSKILIKKYNIKKTNVLGHSDIAFDRKKDPGEKFPWERLSKNKICIWHNIDNNILEKLRSCKASSKQKTDFFKYLIKIGYFVKTAKSKSKKINLIKNFQRHFRQNLVNGIIDQECLIIAKRLCKLS